MKLSGISFSDIAERIFTPVRIRVCAICIAAFFCLIGWPAALMRCGKEERKSSDLIKEADELFGKEIYTSAAQCYGESFRVSGDLYPLLRKAECYRLINDRRAFIETAGTAILLFPSEPGGYTALAGYYLDSAMYGEAKSVCDSAASNGVSAPALEDIRYRTEHKIIRRYVSADGFLGWHETGGRGYAVIRRGDLYGLMGADGKILLKCEYEWLGMYDPETGTIPALDGGIAVYLDTSGRRKLVPDGSVLSAGCFTGGLAPVRTEEGYRYIDGKTSFVSDCYDFAGAFSQGAAAVEKDGKWALVDLSFRSLTGFVYDEIKTDAYGFAVCYGRAVACRGGLYFILDAAGREVSQGFEDALLPASADGAIAVKTQGKWGFADRNGKTVSAPEYDSAGSYSCGMAPVMSEGEWFFIDSDGKRVDGTSYGSAGSFGPGGIAFVTWSGVPCLAAVACMN